MKSSAIKDETGFCFSLEGNCNLFIVDRIFAMYIVQCTLQFLHCYCIQDIEHCKLSIGNCPFYIVGILYLVPHTMYIVSRTFTTYNVQIQCTIYIGCSELEAIV